MTCRWVLRNYINVENYAPKMCLEQVNRVTAAFGVIPPVYLVKESDNTAIFPNDATGRFFSCAFTVGAVYDVHGSDHDGPGTSSGSGMPSGPFGAYTRYAIPNPPPHPPPITCPKKHVIKKNIGLASLSARKQGPSSRNRIQYTAVTQMTVSLDPSRGQCCVSGVCEKVKEQIGFDVVLLDSKCFPVLPNDDTSCPEFWKSTRKIIAAPTQSYEKLGGVPADTDWLKECDQENEPPPKKARSCKGKEKRTCESAVDEKLDIILKRLDTIEHKVNIFEGLKKSLECCICKLPCQSPIVSPCCGQVVGCTVCVDRWLERETSCPLCRANDISQRFALKGFEDTTSCMRMLDSARPSPTPTNNSVVIVETDSEDTDFEMLPSFRTPSRSARGN